MKITILSVLVLFPAFAFSQVGINTNAPKATLDVVGKPTDNTATDGIIAPRLTGNELKAKDVLYGVSQKGALIYATAAASPTTAKTVNVTAAGYYYFDGSVWQAFTGGGSGTQTDDWHISGNTGTTPDTHFLGTTDDVDFMLKRNNVQAGLLTPDEASFGAGSLPDSSAGLGNTAFGAGALQANTTGFGNSAFGYNALNANTTGNRNSAFGRNTLMVNNGSDNNAFGSNALTNNTTGEKNVAIGLVAMSKSTVGNSNTALGEGSMWLEATGDENTAVGSSANPSNTGANRNTSLGTNPMQHNTTGNDNTALGWKANQHSLATPLTGSNMVAIGYTAGVSSIDPSNFIAIGYSAGPLGNNYIRLGNSSITTAAIQVAWSVTSDKRYKNDIKDSYLGLDFIKELRPVSYIRKNDDSKNREYGFIAQELQETLTKNGATDSAIVTEDKDTMLSVRYNDLFAPLVKTIQQQQAIIAK
uniref:tail fiber domain-containing protein n=1 Tax=Chryseobacterium sp. VD8 TaxID=3081254 RepID=UPI003017C443